MVDGERESIVIDFTSTNVESGSREKPKNVVDRLQIEDVHAWNTRLSTLKSCGSIPFF